jgi:hypothetical protein
VIDRWNSPVVAQGEMYVRTVRDGVRFIIVGIPLGMKELIDKVKIRIGWLGFAGGS